MVVRLFMVIVGRQGRCVECHSPAPPDLSRPFGGLFRLIFAIVAASDPIVDTDSR